MGQHTTRRKFLGGGAAAGLAALPGCSSLTPFVGQREERTETIPPEDATALAVSGSNGDVTIVGQDRDDVHLDVVKTSSSIRTDLSDLHLRTEHAEGTLELRSVWEGSDGWFTSQPSMDLDVGAPRELAVDRIETSVGAVTVRDVEGDLTAVSSTGTVDLDGVDGTVAAETSTGSVRIRDVERVGDVGASTGSVDVSSLE